MKIGILGSGTVATTLGSGLLKHGHQIMLGTREARKLADWAKQNPQGKIGSLSETATFGEVVILAVKGTATKPALESAGSGALGTKVVIDATNPIAEAPPVNGVLQFTSSINESAMEGLQKEFPSARFVKAFNSVGAGCMIDPKFIGGKPTMFICGNDAAAKQTTTNLLTDLGWETADMGKIEAARAIEPLCMLWCIPGFVQNDWMHAFKLLK